MSALSVRLVSAAEVSERHDEFRQFEHGFVYPLGEDTFRIDHGGDYLAFFRSLGEPAVLIAENGQQLLGVCVAVKRPFRVPTWYLCDLKVAPAGRGLGLAKKLFALCTGSLLQPGEPAFGVSMNPAVGRNRMVRAALRFAAAGFVPGPQLAIYSLDHAEWLSVHEALEHELGRVDFFDPSGAKDIVLQSTDRPMPLLHAQHGRYARRAGGPARAGHVHMLSLPAGDPLVGSVACHGLSASATATVLHRGMATFDWRHLLTSDI